MRERGKGSEGREEVEKRKRSKTISAREDEEKEEETVSSAFSLPSISVSFICFKLFSPCAKSSLDLFSPALEGQGKESKRAKSCFFARKCQFRCSRETKASRAAVVALLSLAKRQKSKSTYVSLFSISPLSNSLHVLALALRVRARDQGVCVNWFGVFFSGRGKEERE